METITPGMCVQSLEGRAVGRVLSKRSCCFSFETPDRTKAVSVKAEGIFDIQYGEVTLIYVAGESHKYPCASHKTVVGLPKPLSTWPPAPRVLWRR